MYTIKDLYDLDHTLAKDYLSQFTYPWEALKGIKDMILQLGPTLGDDYEEVNGVLSKDGSTSYETNPLKVDTDEDGLNDDIEIKLGLDPTNFMTDGMTPDNERKIDEALQNSLLNEEYKQKLKDYANMMKKKIEEEKKRMKSEMEKM